MNNDFICMKASFYSKREARRTKLQNDENLMARVMQNKADDLDAQYKRVFTIKGKTAQININGVLSPDGADVYDVWLGYGGTAYNNIIRAANESKKLYDEGIIENVVVKMNTPGGSIDQLDQAYQALLKISDIGIVTNESMIASAGVWLASAFEKIVPSTDSAQIGSIGVVYVGADYSSLYDNFGIKEIEITNTESPNKRPDLLTDEGVAVVRKELDELYTVFISKVMAKRSITEDQINNLKGEMVIAERAVNIGLMDAMHEDEDEDVEDDEDEEIVDESEDVQDDETEDDAKENEEKDDEEMIDEDDEKKPVDESEDDATASAERKRLIGLAKIAGVNLSDEFKAAIESGKSVGDFAVELADAKEAKNKSEIVVAQKLREKNADQTIKISGKQHGENTDERDELTKMLDKKFQNKGIK